MKFAKTGINGDNRQFISVEEPTWEDGLKVATKTGFIEVQPEVADRKLEEFKTGKLIANFGDKNRTTGLYEIQVIKAEVEKSETTVETGGELTHKA